MLNGMRCCDVDLPMKIPFSDGKQVKCEKKSLTVALLRAIIFDQWLSRKGICARIKNRCTRGTKLRDHINIDLAENISEVIVGLVSEWGDALNSWVFVSKYAI